FQISDIPSHSTNQCITTTAPTVLSTHNHTHLPMASPKLGVASTSSSMSTAAASNYPLTFSLGLPSQKSFTTGTSGHSGVTFPNQSIPAAAVPSAPSQDPKLSAQGGTTVSSSGRTQHACRFCRKLFSGDSSLQIHLRSHTGERPYQCPVCFSRFTTRGNLKVHFFRAQNSCPLCQRKFTNALVLQHHIRMHLGGQLPPEHMTSVSLEEPSPLETSASTRMLSPRPC
uniref:Spalt-like transcription factor 2 n=1 Tax=Sinocyclocheilus grahami TaxID=75366 RepID=A0A672R566_SINGR